MNKRVAALNRRAAFDRDAVRRALTQVQSVFVAAGAGFGAGVTLVAASHVGIESGFAILLGLLAAGMGAVIGLASATRIASVLRR